MGVGSLIVASVYAHTGNQARHVDVLSCISRRNHLYIKPVGAVAHSATL